ncbi:hypothetical protein RUND412_000575 [Rhizina undulata]
MSYSRSSREISLQNDHILVAQCRNVNGEFVESRLDLNRYLGNINGVFYWNEKVFSNSAREVRLEYGSELFAELRREDGSWRATSVDLNDHIGNHNGKLVFQYP